MHTNNTYHLHPPCVLYHFTMIYHSKMIHHSRYGNPIPHAHRPLCLYITNFLAYAPLATGLGESEAGILSSGVQLFPSMYHHYISCEDALFYPSFGVLGGVPLALPLLPFCTPVSAQTAIPARGRSYRSQRSLTSRYRRDVHQPKALAQSRYAYQA